jgi:hypothetical protein
VQQHAQPVHRRVAALAGSRDERRLARNIDDVGHQRAHRQAIKGKIQRWLADHALVGGVDQHRCVLERVLALLPAQRRDRAAELVRQGLGSR